MEAGKIISELEGTGGVWRRLCVYKEQQMMN